jgi:hypothetical protein
MSRRQATVARGSMHAGARFCCPGFFMVKVSAAMEGCVTVRNMPFAIKMRPARSGARSLFGRQYVARRVAALPAMFRIDRQQEKMPGQHRRRQRQRCKVASLQISMSANASCAWRQLRLEHCERHANDRIPVEAAARYRPRMIRALRAPRQMLAHPPQPMGASEAPSIGANPSLK